MAGRKGMAARFSGLGIKSISVSQRLIKKAKSPLTKATLSEVEQQHVEHVLNLTNGNQAKSAKILGISLTTLWRKLKNK
jgi:DNA-binding protein Fis